MDDSKKLILFAGVNGAGKSTLFNMMSEFFCMPRINIDEIAKQLGNWKDSRIQIEAGKKALALQNEYFSNDVSFNRETTLCGHEIIETINSAKRNGYFVEIHYVGVDSVEICKDRIASRVLRGGHGISDEDIERRYIQSLQNVKKILSQCDVVFFYDNSLAMHLIADYKEHKIRPMAEQLPEWFENNII